MKPTTLTLGLVLLITASGLAGAQDQQPTSRITGQPASGPSRVEFGLSYAQAIGTSTFKTSQTIREYVEDGTLNSTYKVGGSPGVGAHLQYNLTQQFGIRLGAQAFSRTSDGTFTGQIPHPLFFGQPRPFTASQSGLGFSETAFSLTAVLRGGSGKWNFALEGGPAYFNVSATLAEKARYSEIYPFDTVTVDGVSAVKKTVSPFGFAAGVELGREITNSVSVVAQARYTGGTGSVDVNGTSVDIKAGGLQARLGLRFIVARKRF